MVSKLGIGTSLRATTLAVKDVKGERDLLDTIEGKLLKNRTILI